MTQTESSAFRARDEQAQWMARCIKASGDRPSLEGFLREHIRIAEARGAEEQRRKDAKGQEPFAYVDPTDVARPFEWIGSANIEIRKKAAWSYTMPLYTRPANVAALEARVKVLEEYYEAAEAISFNASSEQCDRLDKARAALTREGGE